MTIAINWLSPHSLHALGWALVHFLWQGAALAAFAAAAMTLSRSTSARYIIALSALILMFFAPLATFAFYAQQNPGEQAAASSAVPAVTWPISRGHIVVPGPAVPVPVPPVRDRIAWLVEAWLMGVALFSLRSAGGFLLLERGRRKQSSVVEARLLEICYTLQDRLAIRRAIQYCECKWLQAPAVVGWFRPIVFLPAAALTGLSEDQLQAVIAHELAHVRRLDSFVNLFQICVETLLFYHPAVWWLNKRIRLEREHCCDEVAVSLCGNAVEYARALTLMEEWRSAPRLVMAANRGPLTERIIRLLGLKTLGAGMRAVGISGSILCLTAALLSGNALLEIARPAAVHANSPAQADSGAADRPAATAKPSAAQSSNTHSTRTKTATNTVTTATTSYIDGLKSVGLTDLSIDTLIALKIQDVTPEYVRGLQEQGVHPDAEKLIAMRVQGVSPDYVRQWHDSGLNPNLDQLIALKVQGADAEYYRGMKETGLNPDVDRLIAMKVQGVTPEYVRELHAAGLSLTADQVISMKVQDVTPEYMKKMQNQGINLNPNEAISMRVQDVTPEYVHEIQALGLKPSANELISMRVQDVTPEYIKALQSAGLNPSINDIISAKVQDVTPEFIERAKQHGFKDLTLQKLIRLRQLGILDSKADI
jgi:beta-lactamase regulating signal transducer with metallopeptidase domain/uncharacterized protein YnzC (UPF0291/DUF896 family)